MNKEILLNKATLLNALNDYLVGIQIDPIGDIISKVNAVITCTDYVSGNDVITDDWVKSNWIVIVPAINHYRKSLKRDIDHAKITGDEKSLSELRTEYKNLQPYIALTEQFQKLLR